MKIVVGLRDAGNHTNFRSEAMACGMEAAGHTVIRQSRGDTSAIRQDHCDLYIQTGFNGTMGLHAAIDAGIPYIIAEAPFWRHWGVETISSYGYNGLAGGAYRSPAGSAPRDKPVLRERKSSGSTTIFGQKPTDHSLRGVDHVGWIESKRREYPDAEFRPHPLMVPQGSLEALESALERCLTAITYTSTVGAEALIAGCVSEPEHWGSTAYQVTDREQWIHDLSWGQFTTEEFATAEVAQHILSGYEEAKEHPQEIPREKVDGTIIQREYHRRIICGADAERA